MMIIMIIQKGLLPAPELPIKLWCKMWQFRAVNNLLFIVHGCGFQIRKNQDYWDQGYV